MSVCKHGLYTKFILNYKFRRSIHAFYCTQASEKLQENADEFRVYEIYPSKRKERERKASRRFMDAQVMPPREKRMPIDQDWPTVWPAARTFQPSVVPLPVHQGYVQKKAPPGKYANAELMKIPNFFHLTPPAIKRHCEAIKKFCTKWPEGLETDEKCDEHFPLEVITTDYCHSSPTIRDDRSRIVTVKVKLKSLKLDYHAKDKILRLVGENRYDAKTDSLAIVADRCPLRKQNYDYLMYILAAVYHESLITEPWEAEKTEADMEKFFFEGSRNQKCMMDTINSIRTSSGDQESTEQQLKESKELTEYGDSLTELLNEGESSYSIQRYKNAVANALKISVQRVIVQGEILPSN